MPYYLSHPLYIATYDPQWPVLFAQEKQRLQAALSAVILAIEHIGSTAVVGLDAKPILDMLAAVNHLHDVSASVELLRSLGYEDAEINPKFGRRLFCKGGYNVGTHHLHFVVKDSEQWLLPLRFRDYLQAHPQESRNYGELKKRLAQKHGQDLDGYSEEKGPFVEAVLAAATVASRE